MSAIDAEQSLSGAIIVNGVHVAATSAAVRTTQPAGSITCTFNAPFVTVWRGQHLSYRKGQTLVTDTATRTAWVALGASMTTVA